MRQIETSDPEIARLVEQIDAGRSLVVYRLQMPTCPKPSPCLVGGIYLVSGRELLLFNVTQRIQVTATEVARPRRRRGFLMTLLAAEPLPPFDVSCDHRIIRPDGQELYRMAHEAPAPGGRRRKQGEPLKVPALSVW